MNPTVGEEVWRRETPHILAALIRRYGDFAACEDAVQEALIEASRQWPARGVPEKPRGWLLRVASRRLIDARRQDVARRDRERRVFTLEQADHSFRSRTDVENRDASLEVLTLSCHPALMPESQVTLTLRTILGLTTQQIAAVYLIQPSTAGQRISRAKATIELHHRQFPPPASPKERLPALMHALYLMYTAGHSRSDRHQVLDAAVTTEAIRLHAVRAPLLEACGRRGEALEAFKTASRLSTNIPEQRFLNSQITRLQSDVVSTDTGEHLASLPRPSPRH